MKNNFWLLSFLLTLAIHCFSSAQRIGFSSENWKIIKTPHFDVIFTAKQQDLGLYYANLAERAYENLATVFINRPDERTVIVVNDTTDVSNGYATLIPYAHIMAFSVPIGEQESLSEAGDWGRELITHEMTHIMQLEPASGMYRYIRPVLGTIVAPNLLMPLWWKEGMAVEMETQFSPQGRARSSYQDASIRAFVLDKKLFDYTLPRANEVLPSWPYGSRPYLFGSLFWGSLIRDTSTNAANQLANRQGERVPYFVEEPMRELTQKTYEEQYTKALTEAEQNANAQITKLQEQPLDPIQPIMTVGQSTISPTWSESHKILAFLEQIEDKTTIAFQNEAGERILDLKKIPKGTLSSLDFHPTAKKVLYAQVDDLNSKYKVSDLYIYDIEAQKTDRLTQNQRARDASFSESGKKIVFISTYSGRTQIRILDVETKKLETLISSNFKERFQSPIFWSDTEILYSKVPESGGAKLYKISLTDKKEIPIAISGQAGKTKSGLTMKAGPFAGTEAKISSDSSLRNIRFLKKKGNNLYFTSTENGVNNIYVTTDLKTATAMTHVPAGIWSFDVDSTHQKAWASNMTSSGFQVAPVDLKARQSLPVIENKLATHYKYVDKKTPDKIYPSEEYSSGTYLWPQYWIPFVATSTTGKGVYFQAQTSGHDPINIHEYALLGSYDTDLQKGGFQGFYLNSSTSIPVQLAAVIHSQAFGTNENIVETKTASLGLLPVVFKLSKNMNVELGVEVQQTEIQSSVTQHWGPFATLQYMNYSQNIFQVSPERGWGGYLKYEHWKNIKDSRDYNKALGSLVGYFSPWLPTHHTFMARASALMTFESLPARFGTSNDSLFANSDLIVPQFVLRGYTPSQFYGRSVWNANIEYRFPIKRLENGTGTDPYFLKRISGALVTDGLGVEGGSLTEDLVFQKRALNESFWSSGAEIKFETTIGYVLPVNFVLGVYQPHSPLYRSSAQIGLNIQIGGF